MKNLTLISLSLALLAGTALAGDPKAGGGGAPPPPAKDAKAPAPPPDKKAPPADAPKAPDGKPPQELTDAAKAMTGTWNCSGTADMGGTSMDIKGTVTHKSDLDGWWITSTIKAKAGGKIPFNGMFMTTYDGTSKKWFRQSANGHGGHGTAWGTMADKKATWEGTATFGGADMKIRGTDDMTSAKEVHIVGEVSKDGGKTWMKDHDVTCKK